MGAQAVPHGYLNGRSKVNLPITSGIVGAGRILLSAGVATVSIVALTIYFLVAVPGVRDLWLLLIARSRRERVALSKGLPVGVATADFVAYRFLEDCLLNPRVLKHTAKAPR